MTLRYQPLLKPESVAQIVPPYNHEPLKGFSLQIFGYRRAPKCLQVGADPFLGSARKSPGRVWDASAGKYMCALEEPDFLRPTA